jgi:hypothetical protein
VLNAVHARLAMKQHRTKIIDDKRVHRSRITYPYIHPDAPLVLLFCHGTGHPMGWGVCLWTNADHAYLLVQVSKVNQNQPVTGPKHVQFGTCSVE